MRLKEIKPGMMIHCKTQEEMEQAIESYEIDADATFIWNYKSSLADDDERMDCLLFDKGGNYKGFCSREYFEGEGYTITEFSDLILTELTAAEVLEICGELCKEYSNEGYQCSSKCPFAFHGMKCILYMTQNPDKTIEACEQWKSSHEKKEPEIETVDICRIIEIQPDGRKRCVHEEDLASGSTGAEIKILVEAELKRYISNHDGEFIAVHEVVSRVKR